MYLSPVGCGELSHNMQFGHRDAISKKLYDTKPYTGCPINWYPLSISIPDFPDGPMKKS